MIGPNDPTEAQDETGPVDETLPGADVVADQEAFERIERDERIANIPPADGQ